MTKKLSEKKQPHVKKTLPDLFKPSAPTGTYIKRLVVIGEESDAGPGPTGLSSVHGNFCLSSLGL